MKKSSNSQSPKVIWTLGPVFRSGTRQPGETWTWRYRIIELANARYQAQVLPDKAGAGSWKNLGDEQDYTQQCQKCVGKHLGRVRSVGRRLK